VSSASRGKGKKGAAIEGEGESTRKTDVGELLGLDKKAEDKDEKQGGVFDLLGSSGGGAGSGMFGGGGWD
jgi:hypothetical protein